MAASSPADTMTAIPAASAPQTLTDGLATPRRHWAHVAIGLAIVMSVMDGTIANVALPTFVSVLHISPSASIWIVNAYQLSVCMSLLAIGSLGDIYGHDRVFRICLVIFTAASLACALSHGLVSLACARFVQGIGGAGILGVTNAMLRGIYPSRELTAGIGRNTIVVGVALAAGPSIASLILSVATWPWLFAVNVPIGVITLIMANIALPAFPRGRHEFDLASAVMSAAVFGLLALGIDAAGHRQGQALAAGELVLSAGLAVLLIRRQAKRASPLLPVDLFKIRLFTLSVSTTFLASMAQLMAYVAIPFLFHLIGRGQTHIGLLITPWPVMVGLVAPFAGRLARRFAPQNLASAGLILFAAGLILLTLLPPDATVWNITWRMLLCGFGYGLFLPPNSTTQISAVPKPRSGGASTVGATARVLGQAIGAALVAFLLAIAPQGGISLSLDAAAAIAILAAVVSAARGAPMGAPENA
jgi:DHA2 family multidrug resistance protein-like MFS transporter